MLVVCQLNCLGQLRGAQLPFGFPARLNEIDATADDSSLRYVGKPSKAWGSGFPRNRQSGAGT